MNINTNLPTSLGNTYASHTCQVTINLELNLRMNVLCVLARKSDDDQPWQLSEDPMAGGW